MGTYINAMERLVEQEVTRQIQALPPKSASHNSSKEELVAYALNQLPALYATSERGLVYQLQRGQAKYGSQIRDAVHRAFIAVQRDPFRTCAPLKEERSPQMQEMLHRLQRVLKNDQLDWETLVSGIEQALRSASRTTASSATQPRAAQVPVERSPAMSATEASRSPYLRRYSTVAASSPFPQVPTSDEAEAASPVRATVPPRANRANPSANSAPNRSSTSESASSGGTYAWDDPFCRD